MLKADLHVHSVGSYDGSASVGEILDAAEDAELDAVAVTDHDEIEPSLEAAERAPERGLVGVPGVEVSTADGHLLALGVENRPSAGKPVAETVERVRELGGIAVVPHPFQRMRHGVGAVEDCDAVETYNSRLFTGLANRQARKFARRHGLPELAGSDAHIAEMVGRAYTEIDAERDVDSLLEAIKDGRTETYGRRTPITLSARQFAARVPGRLKNSLLSLF
ncbi:MAG: PHP domain-containing protein [Halobacteriales archaeon]